MPKTAQDYLPDIGGFLDGQDGDITDALFVVASGAYADKSMVSKPGTKPSIVLMIKVSSTGADKPVEQSYSVGSQDIWEIVNDGKSIQNTKNPDRHSFRDGSVAYALVKAILTTLGSGDIDKGQLVAAKRDFWMTEAGFYTGLNFAWKNQKLTWVINGVTVESNPPLPDRFLGETASAKKAGPAKAAAPAADTSELDAIVIENASGMTESKLKAFAVKNETIKANGDYLRAIVNGKGLRALEASGLLTMDPTTKLYL